MLLNSANLANATRGFKLIFQGALSATVTTWQRVAMLVPSTTREEAYHWLGVFPKMREWIGDRVVRKLRAYDFSIVNKPYESTVEVDRDDFADDRIGIYNPLFNEMGRSAAAHPDELIFALLKAGFATVCFDGQFFFDTDHPVGDPAVSVSNSGGGGGTPWFLLDTSRAVKPLLFQNRKDPEFVNKTQLTDDNVFWQRKFVYGVDARRNVGFGLWQLAYGSKQALDATNYSAARAAMMAFKDDEGKPLGIVPNLLVVPPSLEDKGRILLLNQNDAAGATNPWQGTAELLVTPWLA